MKKHSKRLSAEERPLFAPWHAVHSSAKDKAQTRRSRKKALRKDVSDYYNQ